MLVLSRGSKANKKALSGSTDRSVFVTVALATPKDKGCKFYPSWWQGSVRLVRVRGAWALDGIPPHDVRGRKLKSFEYDATTDRMTVVLREM